MDNDKAFFLCALILTVSLVTLFTVLVLTGIASVPPALVIAEHLAMSLGFRAAYKGIGGFSWDDWSVLPDRAVGTAVQAPVAELPAAAAADPALSREAA